MKKMIINLVKIVGINIAIFATFFGLAFLLCITDLDVDIAYAIGGISYYDVTQGVIYIGLGIAIGYSLIQFLKKVVSNVYMID